MTQDLFVTVEKQVTQTEEVKVTVKEISILIADVATAGVLAIVLAAKDEEGKWREDVATRVVRIVDNLESEVPLQRYAASAFHTFLLYDANHPLVAALASHMNSLGIDIMAMTKADAAKAMLPRFMSEPNSNAEAPE